MAVVHGLLVVYVIREGQFVGMERLLEAAWGRGCFLELNAQPERLDPPAMSCKLAQEMGLKMAISTDAHSVNDLDLMRFGIDQARRGWLAADDVLNTRSWKALQKLLKSRRHAAWHALPAVGRTGKPSR